MPKRIGHGEEIALAVEVVDRDVCYVGTRTVDCHLADFPAVFCEYV